MSRTEVWMCYGCCCGVAAVDLKWKTRREPLDRIRGAIQTRLNQAGVSGVPIRKTGCLGPCSKGNMVVVRREGIDAVVFGGINTAKLGEEVAEFAMEVDRRGWGATVPGSLEKQVFGTVSADEVGAPPSAEPYKDRH